MSPEAKILHPLDFTRILHFGKGTTGRRLSGCPELKNCHCFEVSLWSKGSFYFPRSDTDEVFAGQIFLRTIELLAPRDHAVYFSVNNLFKKITRNKKTGEYTRQHVLNSVRPFIMQHKLNHIIVKGLDAEGEPWDYFAFDFPSVHFHDTLALHWQNFDIEGYVISENKRNTLHRCLTSLPSPQNFIKLVEAAHLLFEVSNEGASLTIVSSRLHLKDFVPVAKDRKIRDTLRDLSF